MTSAIQIIQIVLSIILIISILLQQRGSGLGMAFGGEGNVYRSRRGIEQFLFIFTIIVAILFCATVLLSVFMTK